MAITGRWTHAFAAYGAPKYGADFKHVDYVDPDAPKGGTLRLRNPDRRSSFDKFNPWTVRGNAPAGVLIWMVEGLAQLSLDEPMTVYGLLAESIYVEADFSAASFRLRPEARFGNGDPVTPEDVRHSLEMLKSKGAGPNVQTAVEAIARAVVVDARTVRFEFAEKGRGQVFTAATMPVFSRKWTKGRRFDETNDDIPILTGPYLIDKFEMPRRIEFKRNPAYWGAKLPLRRGHFNFDRVVYRLYEDQAVGREAFKAGEFDIYRELRARAWVRQHQGVKWDDGRIVKATLDTSFGQALQSYIMNMRLPKFQDIRVREAIGLAYDFEIVNKTKVFKRGNSQFNNSEFAAVGLPSAEELKLLEPFRAELPATVFGPAFVAPRTDDDPNGLRRNLRRARDLLAAAGWTLDEQRVLRNAKGETLTIEYLSPGDGGEPEWQRNLSRLGIQFKLRTVDFALYTRRLLAYDFELCAIALPAFTLPDAAELLQLFGSKSADEPGNSNWRGVKSRAADALIAQMNAAQSLPELRTAARALDRVITWSWWQVPHLYKSSENVSYWNRFGVPKQQASYFNIDHLINGFTEWAPWPLYCWWMK